MSNTEPVEGLCNAQTRDGGYCGKRPVTGSERCRYHGGFSTGPPKGSANALKSGATASPINLYNNLEDEDLAFVEELRDAYLEIAPFTADDPRAERLLRISVMIYQEWKGQEQVLEQGMAVSKLRRSEGPDGSEKELELTVTADGEMIAQTEEHYLCARIDRLNDKIRHNLKDLGCLPDPESSSGESVAQVLSVANSLTDASETSDS